MPEPGEGFWHKPHQMRLAANALLLAAGLALGYAALAALLMLPIFPLKELVVTTPLAQVTQAQVEYAAQESMTGNFFTVNLEQVRTSFKKLPWVRRATVKRRWPDGLELDLEEQVAVAQWRSGTSEEVMLLNAEGDLFPAASREPLPLLWGPPGREADVLVRYREFANAVAPMGRKLIGVGLSSREAWSLRLDNGVPGGLLVELGREQAKAPIAGRLARFVKAWKETAARVPAPMAAVDLRYPNGFAVRPAGKESTPSGGAKKLKETR